MAKLVFHSIEEATTKKEEILKTLEETQDELSSYEKDELLNQLISIDKYIENNLRAGTVDKFINQTSIGVWLYVILLIILSIYPLFKLISLSIVYAFITADMINNLTEEFQAVTLVVVSFLIYPLILALLDFLPFLFIKKKENKKLYRILSLIFTASFLTSFLICLIKYIILPLSS